MGLNIVTNLDGLLAEFDCIIGIDRLKAIHINDSLNPLGSHKDRHARIGEGHIGLAALSTVTIQDPYPVFFDGEKPKNLFRHSPAENAPSGRQCARERKLSELRRMTTLDLR
ncbi:MAG: hypothetical protein IKR65_08775 [Selenomonadaceae bacterium]|nr:hypothetical protein [Selenomonadaceae bacterium]